MTVRIVSSMLLLLGISVPAAVGGATGTLLVGDRPVPVDATTLVLVDDQLLPTDAPLPRANGQRVEVRFDPAQRLGLPGAVAQTVVFSYALRGPITSVEPLRVLGQEVGLNAATGSEGLPGGSFANLALGNHVDVSGYIDSNASLLASFVEFSPEPIARWLLTGVVTAIDPGNSTADLGAQRISLDGVAATDCGAGLAAGQFIEIRADAIAPFDAATVLDSITSLRCVARMPIGTPGALGAIGGLVVEVLSPTSFQFGPYVVQWDAATEFRFGAPDDLMAGAELEVDGTFGAGSVFLAQGIQFGAPMIRLEGPVTSDDVVSGAAGSITLLGNTVHRIAQVRDDDGIYANGIPVPLQIEVRGYRDSAGVLHATRVRERGAPDLQDARVGGPVDAVARPLLTVLGVQLDSTGALFEGPAGEPIDADEFFAGALTGALVEQSGSYDPLAHRISGGVVALILAAPAAPASEPVQLLVGRLGDADAVFSNGFE